MRQFTWYVAICQRRRTGAGSGISLPYLGPDTLATLSDYQERRPATS